MPEQVKKSPNRIGFLAHVGASRGAPRKDSNIPGPKTGDVAIKVEFSS